MTNADIWNGIKEPITLRNLSDHLGITYFIARSHVLRMMRDGDAEMRPGLRGAMRSGIYFAVGNGPKTIITLKKKRDKSAKDKRLSIIKAWHWRHGVTA